MRYFLMHCVESASLAVIVLFYLFCYLAVAVFAVVVIRSAIEQLQSCRKQHLNRPQLTEEESQ